MFEQIISFIKNHEKLSLLIVIAIIILLIIKYAYVIISKLFTLIVVAVVIFMAANQLGFSSYIDKFFKDANTNQNIQEFIKSYSSVANDIFSKLEVYISEQI